MPDLESDQADGGEYMGTYNGTMAKDAQRFDCIKPKQDEVFIGYSAAPGFVTTTIPDEGASASASASAVPDIEVPQYGTYFLQYLCKSIQNRGQHHLDELFTICANKVKKMSKHIPQKHSTLTKNVVFPTKK